MEHFPQSGSPLNSAMKTDIAAKNWSQRIVPQHMTGAVNQGGFPSWRDSFVLQQAYGSRYVCMYVCENLMCV
jgi:hypothetical protein